MAVVNHIAVARDPVFAARVMMLALKAAQQVASEPPETPQHAERVAYANKLFRGEDNPKMLAAHLVASNPTLQQLIDANPELLGSNLADGDLEFVMNTIYGARAAAFA